ncbi:odorant receptor 245 [Nasonia vitripennis]|uniref:Odorant receptor n=1 Tax=Nasonia vitripennis TaxID=7425 RepID=A0A7M6UPS9_NASVI|nr:odorant receptor 245 [Nasonia vitripennis]
MDQKRFKYKAYERNVIWLLKSAGLWPEAHPVPRKILSLVTLFTSFVVMVTATNYSFQNVGNVRMLTKGMSLAVSFSSVFSKIAFFILHQEDLLYLNKHLTGGFMRDMKRPENGPALLSNVKTFNRFLYMHAVSVAIAMIMYSITPLLVLRKHGKYIRTFPSIYPFAYELGGLVHWIIYAVEVSAAATLVTVSAGVDNLFGFYALQMCGELRMLAHRFRDLRAGNNYKDNLKDCIERHQVLINAKNKLEDIFGLITIWLAISGSLVLCSLIFQVSELIKNHVSYLRIAHVCAYLLPKFLQIFLYAWCGNLIAEESKICLYAMYDSHWPDSHNTNSKRDILIVMSQEPLSVVAMGCMVIQLDMFAKIVKTSVSYFFLLRTLSAENE